MTAYEIDPALVSYLEERTMERIPLQLPTGRVIPPSPGGQNRLIKLVIDEFATRFTPGGEVIFDGERFLGPYEGA